MIRHEGRDQDLIVWLRAQLDADEAQVVSGDCRCPDPGLSRADCAARVLAEVDAKRRILDEHKTYDVYSGFGCGICAFNGRDGEIEPAGWCTTVCLVALPYADRPGYRDEWKP